MDVSVFAQALVVLAIAGYVVILYWAIVAWVQDSRAGRGDGRGRVDVVMAGGLVALAILGLIDGGDLVRLGLAALALYRVAEGPRVRRSS